MLELPESTIIALLTDPVLAAKVLLNWDLDDYQAAGLRIDWWFPNTIDDSATGTGKTLRIFLLCCLRAILIPDQVIGVYFPNFQVAKEEFWPYFAKTIGKSDFFAQQLRPKHGRLGESKMPGAWTMSFLNGSIITVPAPGHAQDGSNQAGRSLNTLVVDDWRRCEEKGDAIAKQLIERVRRPCINKEHPVWGNHMHFKGHAESPSHKSQRRVNAFKRQIKDGSTRHYVYTFCYRDISKKWAKLIREDHMINDQRKTLPHDRKLCQLLGVSARAGATFYPESVLWECCREGIDPMVRRERPDDVYILGFDVARSQSARADFSSAFIWRLRKCDPAALQTLLHAGRTGKLIETERKTVIENGRSITVATYSAVIDDEDGGQRMLGSWEIAAVYAYTLTGKEAEELAGFIYWLDERFGFETIVMDPGAAGGGVWVYDALKKGIMKWGGVEKKVTPIIDAQEPGMTEGRPILHWFKRSGRIGDLSFIHQTAHASENGFIDAVHRRYQQAWHGRQIAHPLALEDRRADAAKAWEPDQVVTQQRLEQGMRQLTKVFQITNSDGSVKAGSGGFPMYRAQGKKDIAYAGLYGFAGVMLYIESQSGREEADESAFFSVG